MPIGPQSSARERLIAVGCDGSLRAYGWAILEVTGQRPTVIDDGCIATRLAGDDRYIADQDGERLDLLTTSLVAVIDRAKAMSPKVVVIIEAPGGTRDAASAKALQSCYGVSRAVCTLRQVARRTVQQGAVKLLLTGDRDAEKALLVDPVRSVTGWSSSARTKEEREARTDAVAVGLTGLHEMRVLMLPVAPRTPHADGSAGRTLVSSETGSVRAPRGLSTGGLGPSAPGVGLSDLKRSGGEEGTREV